MEKYKKKVKHIFPTFVAIAILTNLIWSFLHWLLAIENDIINIKEEIWNFWIPMVLPWIPLHIWLKPKLKILTFQIRKKRLTPAQTTIEGNRSFFLFISWTIIVGFVIVSQYYLVSETGELKKISNIEEINVNEKVRFYKISDFDINFENGKSTTNIWHGKSHPYIDIYFVYPFETNAKSASIFYGNKYQKAILGKEKELNESVVQQIFYDDCLEQIDNLELASIGYFEKVENNRDHKFFLRALNFIENKSAYKCIILEPKFESYSKRNNKYIGGILFILLFGSGLFLLLLEWPGLSEHAYNKQTKYK